MKRKKEAQFKDLLKWKRESTGHYVLTGEYIAGDRETFAEIKKHKSHWKYCLWTWGTPSPLALDYNWQKFKTAKEIKETVIDLISAGEPPRQ